MLDQAKIDQLKAAHGDVYLLKAAGEELVLRAPRRLEWQQFRDFGSDDRKRSRAAETLFRACCVYPDRAELDTVLERHPGIPETAMDKLSELAGVVVGAETSKL